MTIEGGDQQHQDDVVAAALRAAGVDQPPLFEERARLNMIGVFALTGLAVVNVIGLIAVFSTKPFIEETVFAQLANVMSRTNGLLVLIVLNQVLGLGVLLGWDRSYVAKANPSTGWPYPAANNVAHGRPPEGR